MRSGALVLLACTAASCTEGLPDPTLIDSLRVLAVKAEPPELRDDGTGGTATTRLTALVARPGGGAPDSLSWYRCPRWQLNSNSFTCGLDGGGHEEIGGGPDPIYEVDPSARLEEALAAAEELASGERLEDVRMLLRVVGVWDVVNVSAAAGGERVEAAKRVVLSGTEAAYAAAMMSTTQGGAECAVFGEPVPPNSNPRLSGVRCKRGPHGEESEIAADGSTAFAPGEHALLFPVIDWGAQERYPRFDLLGNEGRCTPVREPAYVSWFCDAGRIGQGDTAAADPNDPEQLEALWTEWIAPRQPPEDGRVHCWAVLRDGRGGTDWRSFTVSTSDGRTEPR